MAFAAWYLNIGGPAGPVIPPAPPEPAIPGVRVMGVIMQSYGNPAERRLHDLRVKRLKKSRFGFSLHKVSNVKQFAYLLNRELLGWDIKVDKERAFQEFITKDLEVQKPDRSTVFPKELKTIQREAKKKETVKLVTKFVKKPGDFDFEEFLKYRPRTKPKHWLLQ